MNSQQISKISETLAYVLKRIKFCAEVSIVFNSDVASFFEAQNISLPNVTFENVINNQNLDVLDNFCLNLGKKVKRSPMFADENLDLNQIETVKFLKALLNCIESVNQTFKASKNKPLKKEIESFIASQKSQVEKIKSLISEAYGLTDNLEVKDDLYRMIATLECLMEDSEIFGQDETSKNNSDFDSNLNQTWDEFLKEDFEEISMTKEQKIDNDNKVKVVYRDYNNLMRLSNEIDNLKFENGQLKNFNKTLKAMISEFEQNYFPLDSNDSNIIVDWALSDIGFVKNFAVSGINDFINSIKYERYNLGEVVFEGSAKNARSYVDELRELIEKFDLNYSSLLKSEVAELDLEKVMEIFQAYSKIVGMNGKVKEIQNNSFVTQSNGIVFINSKSSGKLKNSEAKNSQFGEN